MNRTFPWLWFVLVQIIAFLGSAAGIVFLMPLAACRLWVSRPSKEYPYSVLAWRGGWLTYLWGNEEDGVTGAVFYQTFIKNDRLRAYVWSAWRNSFNNWRFVVRWIGGPFYRWENSKKTWYFQAGFNSSGFPVLSAGRIWT